MPAGGRVLEHPRRARAAWSCSCRPARREQHLPHTLSKSTFYRTHPTHSRLLTGHTNTRIHTQS